MKTLVEKYFLVRVQNNCECQNCDSNCFLNHTDKIIMSIKCFVKPRYVVCMFSKRKADDLHFTYSNAVAINDSATKSVNKVTKKSSGVGVFDLYNLYDSSEECLKDIGILKRWANKNDCINMIGNLKVRTHEDVFIY